MPRRREPDPQKQLSDYINMVVDNLTLTPETAVYPITTEHRVRELQIFALTLLAKPLARTHAASA